MQVQMGTHSGSGHMIINTRTAEVYGVVIGALAVIGLFMEGQLMGLMNVDFAIDVIRIVLAVALLYSGFVARSERLAGITLIVAGIVYTGLGVLGLFDSTLGGLLPNGLTGFDIAFHIAAGLIALLIPIIWNRGLMAEDTDEY